MAKKPKPKPKKRPEIDDDLFKEAEHNNSAPVRIELLLVAILRELKKLNNPEMAINRFLSAIAPLEEKLGPILFQLPPRWHVNVGRLSSFLAALPSGLSYAFEFRDPSWFCDAIGGDLSGGDTVTDRILGPASCERFVLLRRGAVLFIVAT